VSASVSLGSKSLGAPVFSLCPTVHRTTCAVGSLPAYQAFELIMTDQIAKTASTGQQLTVTVNVQGDAADHGSALSPAEASIAFVIGQHGSSPAPVITVPAEPTTVPGLPATTVTPGGVTNLFPVVTPSPQATAASNPKHQHSKPATRVTDTASSLPLDPRLIGGQVIGLAVLAAAITMVVARLSLRAPAPAAPASPTTAAAAPPADPAEPKPSAD
jgi:hypothetical protein